MGIFLILIYITGFFMLNMFIPKKKLSYIILYPLLLGLTIHTIIFIILALSKIYYSLNLFIIFTIVISMVLIFVNKSYKNLIYIENDIKIIPVFYLLFILYFFYKLFINIKTSTFDFYNWDELSCYLFASKQMLFNGNYSFIFSIFSPINYFIGTMIYNIDGVNMVSPKLIMPVLLLLMSLFIYFKLCDNKVNKNIAALIGILFLISSSENIILAKAFYSNIIFSAFLCISIYLILEHYFINKKNNIPYFSLFLLLGTCLTRREVLYLVLPFIILLYVYLIIKKYVSFKHGGLIVIIFFIVKYLINFVSSSLNTAVGYDLFGGDSALLTQFYLKMENDLLPSFLNNVYLQTIGNSSYFFNFMVSIVFIIAVICSILSFIKLKKHKDTNIVNIFILVLQFGYIGIVLITEFIIFSASEFSIAASFSRYLLGICPLSFIIVGVCLFSNTGYLKHDKIKKLPKKKDYKVLVILPCVNTDESVLKMIRSLEKLKDKYDYLVVSSTKNASVNNIFENVNHLTLINDIGTGGLVQAGYVYSKQHNYDITVQLGKNGIIDYNLIESIIKPIKNREANMVIGTDLSTKVSNKVRLKRNISTKIISYILEYYYGEKIYEPTSSFRAIDKSLIDEFSENYPEDNAEPISIASTLRKNYEIKEVQVLKNKKNDNKLFKNIFSRIYILISVVVAIFIESLKRN